MSDFKVLSTKFTTDPKTFAPKIVAEIEFQLSPYVPNDMTVKKQDLYFGSEIRKAFDAYDKENPNWKAQSAQKP